MRIRQLRKAKGWTLAQLSNASGISRVAINRYELGNRVPNVTKAIKLANALDCTVNELLEDDGGSVPTDSSPSIPHGGHTL